MKLLSPIDRTLVVNDGSVDKSGEFRCSVKHSRFRVVDHPVNLRLAKAQNSAPRLYSALHVVWLDANDRCSPQRILRPRVLIQQRDGVDLTPAG